MKGYVAALALLLASHAVPAAPSPTVCVHWGRDCHQWRTVQPQGKSLVTVHERRHAPTILGPWTSWQAVRVTR